MKLAAHPMVVAVALGLLPPSVLDVRGLDARKPDADALDDDFDVAHDELDAAADELDVADELSLTDERAWASVPAPSAEALQESAARYERVALESSASPLTVC